MAETAQPRQELRQPGPFLVRRPALSLVLATGVLLLAMDRAGAPVLNAGDVFLTDFFMVGARALGVAGLALLMTACVPHGRIWRGGVLALLILGAVIFGMEGSMAGWLLLAGGAGGLLLASPLIGRALMVLLPVCLLPAVAGLAALGVMTGALESDQPVSGPLLLTIVTVSCGLAAILADNMLRALSGGDGAPLATARAANTVLPRVLTLILTALVMALVAIAAGDAPPLAATGMVQGMTPEGLASPVTDIASSLLSLPLAVAVTGGTGLVFGAVLLSFMPLRERLVVMVQNRSAALTIAARGLARPLGAPPAYCIIAVTGLLAISMPLAVLAGGSGAGVLFWLVLGILPAGLFAIVLFMTMSFRSAVLVSVPLWISMLCVDGTAALSGVTTGAAHGLDPMLLVSVLILLHAAGNWRQAVAAKDRGSQLLANTLARSAPMALVTLWMTLMAGGVLALSGLTIPVAALVIVCAKTMIAVLVFLALSVVLRRLIWLWERQPVSTRS